jgi:hypothetical protein
MENQNLFENQICVMNNPSWPQSLVEKLCWNYTVLFTNKYDLQQKRFLKTVTDSIAGVPNITENADVF